jgi:outer membrane protein
VKLRDMQAAVSIGLLLMSLSAPQGIAQQNNPPAPAPIPASSSSAQYMTPTGAMPQAPDPKLTEPLNLLDTNKNYADPKSHIWKFWAPYTPTDYPLQRLGNSDRLQGLIRDGKIYLSLADAVALALDNNFDIAIARINLDIADTDILRAKAGSSLRGVSSGFVTGTLGGTTSTITYGRRRIGVEHKWSGSDTRGAGPSADGNAAV